MRRLLTAAAIAAFAGFGAMPHAEATCVTGLACAVTGCTGTVNVCPTADSCSGTVDVCPETDPDDCHGNIDVCLGVIVDIDCGTSPSCHAART